MTEEKVWSWLSSFQKKHLTGSPGLYFNTTNKNKMTGLPNEAQLDIFVKSRKAPSSAPHNWADVLVVGEHTRSEQWQKFIQLARYARNVFASQPQRIFVHGFTITSDKMEMHCFDRSGAFTSEPFNIHDNPERFIQVMAGYCLMNDDELGVPSFIHYREKPNKGKKKGGTGGPMKLLVAFDESKNQNIELELNPGELAKELRL
jgi:hypothetical protein